MSDKVKNNFFSYAFLSHKPILWKFGNNQTLIIAQKYFSDVLVVQLYRTLLVKLSLH